MAYDAERHHRRSVRLRNFDYRQNGAYFVTICTHERECLFADNDDTRMLLNEYGMIASECWEAMPQHFPHMDTDAFVIMPNHVHGIVVLDNDMAGAEVGMAYHAHTFNEAQRQFAQPVGGSLSTIVGAYKSAVSRQINGLRQTPSWTVWQRNYHERIIRNEEMLDKARRYIANNPARWSDDVNHPANMQPL